MTLDELNKNSKFGYRRRAWEGADINSYVSFNGAVWKMVYPGNRNAELLTQRSIRATDWILSDLPNKYYKRVAVVTEGQSRNFPTGTRIIRVPHLDAEDDVWKKADYSNNLVIHVTPGVNCKWEDEMDLSLLLTMTVAMSNAETKDATNSQYVVIVTKEDEYAGYFYSDCLDEVEEIIAKPSNELKKFHVFDYSTTSSQKPRKVISIKH